jgi:predicted membrane protein
MAGLFVIFFGSVFLAQQSGVNIADGILSWKAFLIAFGVVTLFRHNFRGFPGYAMITVGSAFLIDDYYPAMIDTKLILPIIVILFGVVMIAKATNLFGSKKKRPRNNVMFDEDVEMNNEEFITVSTIFGGVKKNVTNNNFRGADISTVFGGTEINLTKAGIQGPVVIDSRTAFGGLTLIVPSTWQVHSNVNAMMGAVEDQREVIDKSLVEEDKIVRLEGTCIFGGVEIKSYA